MDVNVDKIKSWSAVTIFHLIGSVIVPGYLFLFVFERKLFLSIDLFRLSVIGASITAPILMLNAVVAMFVVSDAETKDKFSDDELNRYTAASIYVGGILSMIVIYLVIGVGYFCSLSMRSGIIITVIAEAIGLAVLYFALRNPKNKTASQEG
jgi:hypothetical protein